MTQSIAQKRSNLKPATPLPVIAALFLFLFALPFAWRLHADALSTPRAFTRGAFVYIVEPQRVVFLSMDTRGAHTLYTAPDSQFALVSAVRSGDMIWASNAFGAVIAVNMQTVTTEEFGRGRAGAGGQIDVDRRFVWTASGDTLYRMDLTSREWVSIPIPGSGLSVRGLMSFNDRVHVIEDRAVYILNTVTGDWSSAPHRGFVLGAGDFHRVDESAFFTRERAVFRYDPSRRLWNRINAGGRIRAVSLIPGNLVVSTGNRVHTINARDFTMTPMPALPMLRGVRSVTHHHGRNVGVIDRGLAIFTSPFDFNIAEYPEHVSVNGGVFSFSYFDNIILYTGAAFVFYHPDRRIWSGARVQNRGGERRVGVSVWDENGAYVSLTENLQPALSGTATLRQEPGAEYTEEGGLELNTMSPLGNATINFRTETPDGRVLDISVDNGVYTQPPRKGFYYKGIEGDVFDRASFGVQSMGLSASRVAPDAVAEGGSAVFSGGAKAENRDRSVAGASVGSGFVLSKTYWSKFEFSASGVYGLSVGRNMEIIPSSVRVYVDGVPLQESDYYYNLHTGELRLLRRDKADPTSAIDISFSAKALPDDRFAFEPFPENHFGQYNFAEGTVSPRSWLSARAGVMTLDDGESGIAPTLLAGIPVETRGGANRAFTLLPEIAYDPTTGASAAGVSMGAREGRAFGSYSGLWADNGFDGIDRPMFGDMRMMGEHDASVGYDLRDNLRASWHQFHRNGDGTGLSHFELRTLYTGKDLAPDIELSAASRFTDDPALESGRRRKETLVLRVSDLSSRLLGGMNSIHNVGYDFSWTEYHNSDNRRGRAVHGAASVSPTSSLTFTGIGMYGSNPSDFHVRSEINPSLAVYARDLPRGVDASAAYSVHSLRYRTGGSTVLAGGNIFGYFYPGEYADALEKFILRFGYLREIESFAPPTVSPLKYVFNTDENTYAVRTMEQAGLVYVPTENLLLSSVNSRNTDKNAPTSYTTNDRIKVWLAGGSGAEANFYASHSSQRLFLGGDALYEHRWNPVLMTGAGAFGTRVSESFHADSVRAVNFSVGPQLIAAVTKEMSGFVRNIENSHRVWITMNGNDMSSPDVEYLFSLRIRMRPNVALVGELHVSALQMSSVSGAGGIYLHAGF